MDNHDLEKLAEMYHLAEKIGGSDMTFLHGMVMDLSDKDFDRWDHYLMEIEWKEKIS